jgi:hypothetical protein
MTTHRGIRWRLLRWAREKRDEAARAVASGSGPDVLRHGGRREAFAELVEHIESGACDAPFPGDAA